MKRDMVPGLGAKIRDARAAAGLTQGQLAERSGIVAQSLSGFEAGRHTPSIAVLARIARAIGVRPGDLIPDDAGSPPATDTPSARGAAAPATAATGTSTKPKRATA